MLTEAQKEFLLANTDMTYAELTRELNFQFGLSRSKSAVESFFANRRVRPRLLRENVLQAEVDYVRQIAPDNRPEAVLAMLNAQFGKRRCLATLFHMYKKHHIRHKTAARRDGSCVGRTVGWRSGGRTARMLRNRAEYIKAHGEIPANRVVVFLDNNRKNMSPENLFSVPRSALKRACLSGLLTSDPERNKAVYLTFWLQHKSEILRRPPRVRRRKAK
jgi:hypothetical protein